MVPTTTKIRPQTPIDDQRSHAGSDSIGMRIFRTPARSTPILTEGRAVMSPANGHANDPANGSTSTVQQFAVSASDTNIPTALTHNAAKTKELIANLELPFHPSVIESRVTNSSKGGSPRGQVMPYADQRAYTDLLNALFTPAGWTRRPWQWPSQRQRCERPRRQPRSRDRADGTSAGETHASRVVEDHTESVESEGYSGPSAPAEGAGTHANRGTGLPATGCSARQSRAGVVDTNTPLSELQSIDRVDDLQTLREMVPALEGAAQGTTMKR